MSQDARVSRNAGEPPKSGEVGAARWADYLDWVRSEVVEGVLGLTAAQQREPRVASGWTPLELLSHVFHMEQRWFVWGFLGEAVEEPWGDWNVADPGVDEGRWRVPDGVTAEELAQRLEALGRRTTSILRSHPLPARSAIGGRFAEEPPTLEWICSHVLTEYARHAGHLDLVVELTDQPRLG